MNMADTMATSADPVAKLARVREEVERIPRQFVQELSDRMTRVGGGQPGNSGRARWSGTLFVRGGCMECTNAKPVTQEKLQAQSSVKASVAPGVDSGFFFLQQSKPWRQTS
eukprot:TRINITY_DN36901_c0_g1_i1.p2 TRINITY_DN36901_c0_g1~~TRINITY_DN36901_c0_g1_i1.p2  ORF type:complete len:111 (-),score=19.87 TRINITY_DN36901_c0_g1_i1:9-341(-)